MKTQVLIIGGGATGTGLARDLALRGVQCILAEKKDINAGASGGNHGLLHSGARYVASDQEAAIECREEGKILKRLAPHCIDDTGGLFVAVEGDDEKYIADFPSMCEQCGIRYAPLDIKEAFDLEPTLSPKLIAAFSVEDASIDPFKLSLENVAHAQSLGTVLLRGFKATAFNIKQDIIESVALSNSITGETITVYADQIINAAGAWAGEVTALAGIHLDIIFSKGTLLVTQNRIAKRVVNRLRQAGDADILVPGGTVSILGTTSVRAESPDIIYPTIAEIDQIIEEGAAMVPDLETTRYIRAYTGVRPLFGSPPGAQTDQCEMPDAEKADDRNVSRGFALLDHACDGVENLTTITGGKLTTFRLMAERTADLVCRKMGVTAVCRTHNVPLPSTMDGQWSEPGLAPKIWMKQNDPNDFLLCECEMVPKSAVDSLVATIRKYKGIPDLKSIGLRSRIGKGPCQGGFCSLRVAAYMYDQGYITDNSGLIDIRNFINERWRGERPLLWDLPLVQSELQEAMHCGLMCLEL